MSAAVPLSELRTRARRHADALNSDFRNDAAVDGYINEGLKQLYDLLRQYKGQDYYIKRTTIPTVAGQPYYTLPGDFLELLSIDINDGQNFAPVNPFEHADYHSLRQREVAGGSMLSVRYRLGTGDRIELRPQPTAAWSLEIGYVPTFTPLVADGDTFDGVNGWEKHAVLTAAISILDDEETDSGAKRAERDRIESQIRALAPSRGNKPPKVQNTRRDRFWMLGLGFNDWDVEP